MSKAKSPRRPKNDAPMLRQMAELPERCFISHSYKDGRVVKSLIKMLPDRVEAVIFPRQEPDPLQAVSNDIIDKILDCPGLIYLTGGASQKSFWVSFERDYALRSKRAVFAYDPKLHQLTRDTSSPLPLDITVVSHQSDLEKVEQLLSWMADQRHFVINRDTLHSTFGGFTGDIMVGMEELLINGGVILWMMGRGSRAIADSFYTEDFLDYLRESSYLLGFGDISAEDLNEELYDHVYGVFARIDPAWKAPHFDPELAEFTWQYRNLIDLYEGLSDATSFNWNRVDDLMIRLYEQVLNATKGVT